MAFWWTIRRIFSPEQTAPRGESRGLVATWIAFGLSLVVGLGVVVGEAGRGAYYLAMPALACTMVGAVAGFLFALPSNLSDSQQTEGKYQANTNLEQISGWLTKMVVGIALVKLEALPHLIRQLARALPQGGNVTRTIDESFAVALIVYFSVVGFLTAYLATSLYQSRAVALRSVESSISPSEGAPSSSEAPGGGSRDWP